MSYLNTSKRATVHMSSSKKATSYLNTSKRARMVPSISLLMSLASATDTFSAQMNRRMKSSTMAK